ncbi:MAG: NAD(P)/FAD-dependent oxidoreductase [Enterocloster bolteae]
MELWEQNEKLGKSCLSQAKGRCNVTNACDMEELLGSVVSNSKFLYSSFYGFTNQDMMDLLEQAGLRLKVERGNRVFPQSDKSSDVISALSALLRQAGVRVCLNQKAEGLAVEEGVCKGVRCGGRIQTADRVIVATGGLSYPATGSTGDGLKWAADSGHRLTELSPALVPFEVKETETVKELQGLSLKNIEAAVYDGKKELYREFGEMLFTHFGVSGPVLLSASSFCAKAIRKRPLRLVIDLKPALSWEQLDERILRDFSDSRNKQFKNALNHLYPSKLIPVIIDRSSVDPDKKVNEITREERRGLAEATKALEFTLTGLRGYKEAIITQGGISVKDVNPSTMESKKIRGLYFAGEILDLDAVTGGFNLQDCLVYGLGGRKGCGVIAPGTAADLPAGRNT